MRTPDPLAHPLGGPHQQTHMYSILFTWLCSSMYAEVRVLFYRFWLWVHIFGCVNGAPWSQLGGAIHKIYLTILVRMSSQSVASMVHRPSNNRRRRCHVCKKCSPTTWFRCVLCGVWMGMHCDPRKVPRASSRYYDDSRFEQFEVSLHCRVWTSEARMSSRRADLCRNCCEAKVLANNPALPVHAKRRILQFVSMGSWWWRLGVNIGGRLVIVQKVPNQQYLRCCSPLFDHMYSILYIWLCASSSTQNRSQIVVYLDGQIEASWVPFFEWFWGILGCKM